MKEWSEAIWIKEGEPDSCTCGDGLDDSCAKKYKCKRGLRVIVFPENEEDTQDIEPNDYKSYRDVGKKLDALIVAFKEHKENH